MVCLTTDVALESIRRHRAARTSAAALGQGLTAAALMGALIKVKQRVAIKFDGDGPLGKMVTESDSYGRIRGYVSNADVDLLTGEGKEDVRGAIGGNGLLTVSKDLLAQDLYQGVVELSTGDVAREVQNYLYRSEQTPSLVEIGTVSDEEGHLLLAAGLLIQLMPGQDASILNQLRENLQDLPPVANALHVGETPRSLFGGIFRSFEYDILEERDLSFVCQCSWERSERALRMLDRSELDTLIAEGQAVVDCHFCHERYIFGREALEMIRDER